MKIRLIVALIGVPLGAFGYFWLSQGLRTFGAFEGQGLSWTVTYAYAVTLVGVFCGAACRYLIARRATGIDRISWSGFRRDVFYGIDLWLGLFGSPLAFALILQSVSSLSLASLTTLALENGFACTMIVTTFLTDQKPDKRSTIPPDSPSTGS